MKWFKHQTNAHENEAIAELQRNFGFEGVGRYWTILELVAAIMDETDRCEVTYSIAKWCQLLDITRPNLAQYVAAIERTFNIHATLTNQSLNLKIPNLIKYKENDGEPF